MDEEIRVLDEAEAAQLAAGRAARAAHRLDAVRPARTRSLPATPIHRYDIYRTFSIVGPGNNNRAECGACWILFFPSGEKAAGPTIDEVPLP